MGAGMVLLLHLAKCPQAAFAQTILNAIGGRRAAIPAAQGFQGQSVSGARSPSLMTVTARARGNGAAKGSQDAFRGHEHGVMVWDYYNLGPECPALSRPAGFSLLLVHSSWEGAPVCSLGPRLTWDIGEQRAPCPLGDPHKIYHLHH